LSITGYRAALRKESKWSHLGPAKAKANNMRRLGELLN
jgi:hypothetical protein